MNDMIISLTDQELDALRLAAAKHGMSVEGFVLDAALREAGRVVAEPRAIQADESTFEAFRRMLDEPILSTGKLRELFASRAPWEK